MKYETIIQKDELEKIVDIEITKRKSFKDWKDNLEYQSWKAEENYNGQIYKRKS